MDYHVEIIFKDYVELLSISLEKHNFKIHPITKYSQQLKYLHFCTEHRKGIVVLFCTKSLEGHYNNAQTVPGSQSFHHFKHPQFQQLQFDSHSFVMYHLQLIPLIFVMCMYHEQKCL